MSNFHSLEVVSRRSETQLKMGKKLNKDKLARNGLNPIHFESQRTYKGSIAQLNLIGRTIYNIILLACEILLALYTANKSHSHIASILAQR